MRPLARAISPYRRTFVALALVALLSISFVLLSHWDRNSSHPLGYVPIVPVLTPSAPTPTPVPDDPLAPPGLSGTWRPLFVESFNGQTLDTSRWNTCFKWATSMLSCDGSTSNGELQRYLASNITVHGGALDIVAQRDSYSTDTKTYAYTSGVVTTADKFTFRYGYVEARIQMSAGKGIWPAFWMLPEDGSPVAEIDISEVLCDRPDVLHTALHFVSYGKHASVGNTYSGGSFATGYHVVGVDWEPTSVTWYMDGKPVFQVSAYDQIPHLDMYLLLNSAVGGYWSGNPDSTTPFPHHFQVDWVQVWQHD